MMIKEKNYTTLISTHELSQNLNKPDWVVVDCRFDLKDPQSGWIEYFKAHIPGAVYVHLDNDLSGEIIPGKTGRHPLPDPNIFAGKLSTWGIDNQTQVVVYDSSGGVLPAARLWWMLRWLGHERVAVLDGGWQNWIKDNYTIRGGIESRKASQFIPQIRSGLIVTVTDVLDLIQQSDFRILDGRQAERYRGEIQLMGEIPGHIPGADAAPAEDNLDSSGKFLSRENLQTHFQGLIGNALADHVVLYCGSGVRACHNALAMFIAGRGEARIYTGSWSEWQLDPKRPVVNGPNRY